MTDVIEQDALNDPASIDPPPHDDHTHEVKSFVSTPHQDLGLLEKAVKWWKSELGPGVHITRKDGLRHMFIVTSNSYEDREGETITSDALKAYEESCFPGGDLFHCDNPLLWWHDDDVVMGEAVTVNYSEPFLVEVFRELPNPVSKVLWDYAESNGHNAGASHRFGYLEKDRDDDGTFHRIFKQETSYLPERSLAANDRTYAGVIMASPQSDKRLDEIFEQVAGIKGASAMLHAKTGELEKQLEAAGISHKALPPKVVDAKPAVVEGEEIIEDEVEDEVEETKSGMSIEQYQEIVGSIGALVMQLVEGQELMLDNQMGMAKEFTELKELRVSEKAKEAQTLEELRETVKALNERVAELSKRAALAPRSASRELAPSDPEFAKKQIGEAIDNASEARKQQDTVTDGFWGELKPLPK